MKKTILTTILASSFVFPLVQASEEGASQQASIVPVGTTKQDFLVIEVGSSQKASPDVEKKADVQKESSGIGTNTNTRERIRRSQRTSAVRRNVDSHIDTDIANTTPRLDDDSWKTLRSHHMHFRSDRRSSRHSCSAGYCNVCGRSYSPRRRYNRVRVIRTSSGCSNVRRSCYKKRTSCGSR